LELSLLIANGCLFDKEIIGRDQGKTKRNQDGVQSTDKLDERSVFVVVQAKSLEGRLKGVVQVESQKNHENHVEYAVKPAGK